MNATFFRDPRDYQLAVLSCLVCYAVAGLGIGIEPLRVATIIATTLSLQFALSRATGSGHFDPKSPLITALSLCLLLRTDGLALAVLAAILAIAGKFVIRIRGKHLFNPANAGIVPLVLLSDSAWVSTGQWGSATLGALALAGLGLLVLTRARRAETTLAFLATFAALLFGRSAWLGDPASIAFHQLQNGALLIFAFFMISDPKSTPDSAPGRLLFGGLVAVLAFVLRFEAWRADALLLSLFFLAPLVPLIDRLARGQRYQWLPRPEPDKEVLHAIPATGNMRDADRTGQHDGPGILRLLRRARRHATLQPGLAGGTGARRQAHGHHDGQRLPGRHP